MLVRGKSLHERMSSYLAERIESTPNIVVHTETEVTAVDGDGHLKEVSLRTPDGEKQVEADELFVMIGASPKTDWLPDRITKDKAGFVKTGGEIDEDSRHEFVKIHGRAPLPHETAIPGLFAAGDIRFGTTKRVASAVGDGATVVPDLHRYLEYLQQR